MIRSSGVVGIFFLLAVAITSQAASSQVPKGIRACKTHFVRQQALTARSQAARSQAARSQAKEATVSPATIRIRVIYGVKDSVGSIDPALADIKQELDELPFNTFRLLDRLETIVDVNATVELQIPGKRSIAVRFLGLDTSEGKKMLSLELAMKPALKIQLRVADGGRTLLGGPSHQEGKLILDISAELKGQ